MKVIIFFLMLSNVLFLTSYLLDKKTTPYKNKELLDMKYSPTDWEDSRLDPLIKLYDEEGNFFCTGFVIDNNYAATAGHCILNRGGLENKQITIKNHLDKDTGIVAQPAGANVRMDWGIIRGDFSKFNNFLIVDGPVLPITDAVYSCGFPMGRKKAFCNALLIGGTSGFAFLASGLLYPGMSGGPVIYPKRGTVIAINSFAGNNSVGVYPLIGYLAYFGIE